MKVKQFLAAVLLLIVGAAAGAVCTLLFTGIFRSELGTLHADIIKIASDVKIVLMESNVKNRTLDLNSSRWYCKVANFTGGSNPHPRDLYPPNSQIVFFFLEDIENETMVDNYSDIIIRMNQIKENCTLKMVLVFFCEGGYEKLIYYRNDLLHHYKDDDPTSNYGIRVLWRTDDGDWLLEGLK